jgi:nitronate monooxygenase
LAAVVVNAGSIGTISGTGFRDVLRITMQENSPIIGYIGVNLLFTKSNFAETIKAAMEEKVDFIISVAEFSGDMYSWGKESMRHLDHLIG